MARRFERNLIIFAIAACIFLYSNSAVPQQFEFCNNFLQNLSFISGIDEGIEQNLDDNFGWMQSQGYTHLRFFGIFANAYHTFPSPTLDANGYPTNPILESVLGTLVTKANQHGITINFDGWEVIAESNQDTIASGYGYLTEAEVAAVVQEVLAFGITQITEEQFGGSYLQAIQSVTTQMGATHETTAGIWWTYDTIADEQLASVFSFYLHDQEEIDSLGRYHPANLGNLHIFAEGSHYYDVPFSIAVGSFGLMDAENWKNVLLFSRIQHQPERFSIEEENTGFTIWNPSFNFMDDVGSDIISMSEYSFGERPIVNLVYDLASINNESFIPAWYSSLVSNPFIVNAFTPLGFRVIPTVNSILPDADYYYLLLAGGANENDIAALPDYVMPLLESEATVFLQPTFGIPDENDALDWIPVRNRFGLPSGDTYTLANAIPENVVFDGYSILWEGGTYVILPYLEYLPSSQIDTAEASVALTGEVYSEDVALIIRNGNKFLINSNIIHLESSYILSELLSGPLNEPAMADIAMADNKAIFFAEYDTDINIDLPWNGETHIIRFNPQGDRIFDDNVILEGNYASTLMRGELVVLIGTSSLELYPYLPGDANMSVGNWPPQVIGSDVTYLVGYFREINQACLIGDPGFFCSADANGDCQVIGSDVTKLVNYFRGLTEMGFCPDYEPAWPTPDELPEEAPGGWPNCEGPAISNIIESSSPDK